MNEEKIKTITAIIAQAIGQASMQWSETPSGTYKSTEATELVKETVTLILEEV